MYLRRNNLIRKKIERRRMWLVVCITIALVLSTIYLYKKIFHKGDEIFSSDSVLTEIVKNENKSIFNIKELNIKELKDRIILLNVYDIRDFSYIFSVNLANQIEKQYENKVVVIDIIADNFDIDKNTVINYIIKNSIERPVISIENFDLGNNTRNYDKYFVLVNENGIVQKIIPYDYRAENTITTEINKILAEKPNINTEKLTTIKLEKENQPESFIKSLSHITYINRIKDTNEGPYFIITDSKGRKIFFITINGNIVNQIGNGRNGSQDKIGVNASFCYPSGMAIEDNKILYVADTCNDSIRKVDLRTLEVSTLIKNNKYLKDPLNVVLLDNSLIISTASPNTLLKYDLASGDLSPIECENCDKYIIKLDKFADKVYFINTKDYGLFSIDKYNTINKEIDFNELNDNNEIKITGNNNFHIDDTGFYTVDKFKNRILKIKDGKVEEYSKNSNERIYELPTDIVDFRDKLFVTNDGSRKLVQIDKNTKKTKIINIGFGPEYSTLRMEHDSFLNVNNIDEIQIKNGKNNKILLNLDSSYSFETMAPQTLSLYKEDLENNTAILIKTYGKGEIVNNKTLLLPELEDNTNYYLKGQFYYCNYSKETPCLVNKYNKKIISTSSSTNDTVDIEFLY